jgi:hypothetical protein
MRYRFNPMKGRVEFFDRSWRQWRKSKHPTIADVKEHLGTLVTVVVYSETFYEDVA